MRNHHRFLLFILAGTSLLTLVLASCASTSTTAATQSWTIYQSRSYSFRIAIPGSLHLTSATSGASTNENPIWQNADTTQRVLITTTTGSLPGPTFCSEGTPITVGSGIHGRQVEHFAVVPTQTPGSSGPSQTTTQGLISVSAQFVSGGVAIYLQLAGTPPSQTFFNRYGATWNYMLASFTPGAPVGQLATCG